MIGVLKESLPYFVIHIASTQIQNSDMIPRVSQIFNERNLTFKDSNSDAKPIGMRIIILRNEFVVVE